MNNWFMLTFFHQYKKYAPLKLTIGLTSQINNKNKQTHSSFDKDSKQPYCQYGEPDRPQFYSDLKVRVIGFQLPNQRIDASLGRLK